MYIHERKDWPRFIWDQEAVTERLAHFRYKQGQFLGQMELMGLKLREESMLETLTQDVVKTSEIEGEILDPHSVRSSVARRLGIEHGALKKGDRHVEGIVEVVLDATRNFTEPLTAKRLFSWHSKLFSAGFVKMIIGSWRQGPVQVVSGRFGREVVHFEGPASNRLAHEMAQFLDFINQETKHDPVLKSAIAHLWFVTIHPFEDGNGRIGRAIGDMLLARAEKSPCRLYSLSSEIQVERKDYYAILEKTQKGDLDITGWIVWFLECLGKAVERSKSTYSAFLQKASLWNALETESLNERQKLMLNRLLEGFQGHLTTSKWAKIAKCSQDTAYRDIADLVDKKILAKDSKGGRSTNYYLKLDDLV